MTNYQICFTKFNTVKNNDFELTYDDFFNKMNSLIVKDINNYGVYYKDNKYVIVYDNVSYEVKYGNMKLNKNCENQDIVSNLDKLVEASTTLSKLKEEEPETVEVHEKVAKTYKERLAVLENEKNESKKHIKSVLEDFIYAYKDINDGEDSTGEVRAGIGALGSIVMGLIACFTTPPLVTIIGLISFFCLFDGVTKMFLFPNSKLWAGFIPFLFWLIVLPMDIIVFLGEVIKEKISYYFKTKKLRKEIKVDKKVIDEYRKEFIPKSKINSDEVTKYLAKIKNINSLPDNLTTTIEIISDLKDKILEIKDSNLNKKYANDLYEIISYYIDSTNNRKTLDKVYTPKILFEQIRDLKEKVEDELRKQNDKERLDNECNTLIENIEYQKSIGTR